MALPTRKIQRSLAVAVAIAKVRTVLEQLRTFGTTAAAQSTRATVHSTVACMGQLDHRCKPGRCYCRRTSLALCSSPFMQLYISGVQPLPFTSFTSVPLSSDPPTYVQQAL